MTIYRSNMINWSVQRFWRKSLETAGMRNVTRLQWVLVQALSSHTVQCCMQCDNWPDTPCLTDMDSPSAHLLRAASTSHGQGILGCAKFYMDFNTDGLLQNYSDEKYMGISRLPIKLHLHDNLTSFNFRQLRWEVTARSSDTLVSL